MKNPSWYYRNYDVYFINFNKAVIKINKESKKNVIFFFENNLYKSKELTIFNERRNLNGAHNLNNVIFFLNFSKNSQYNVMKSYFLFFYIFFFKYLDKFFL